MLLLFNNFKILFSLQKLINWKTESPEECVLLVIQFINFNKSKFNSGKFSPQTFSPEVNNKVEL